MRVDVEVEETSLENENGRLIDSVVAVCTRCHHEVESYGTSERSVRRCLALMREQCPDGEQNYYQAEDYDGR